MLETGRITFDKRLTEGSRREQRKVRQETRRRSSYIAVNPRQ